MTNKTLESQNKEYGFYGTINLHYSEEKTNKKWADAFKTLSELSGKKAEEIRDYLDSRSGRKLADCIIDSKYDLRVTVIKEYYRWVDNDLHDDVYNKIIAKNSTLFGALAYDKLNKKQVVLLYTITKPERINPNYAMVIDSCENKYLIGMDFITSVEQ